MLVIELCGEWEHFTKLVREPETRKVENDACVNVDGIKYQLSPEFAGQTVTLLWGLLDNELFISYNDKHHGPFLSNVCTDTIW